MSKSLFSEIKLVQFQKRGDDRGHLVVAEGQKEVPFDIQRVFYIFDTAPDAIRGEHANRQTEFMFIVVSGHCRVLVDDGAGAQAEYLLDQPNSGLYIPKMIWKRMYDFSEDCVLLVLCSEKYLPDEYIRDYDTYVKEVNGHQ